MTARSLSSRWSRTSCFTWWEAPTRTKSCYTGTVMVRRSTGLKLTHVQCRPCVKRLTQHPPKVCLPWTALSNYLTCRRNSVDKRTVIENYDLVVRNSSHDFHILLQLTLIVPRRRRARRRRHHPRNRPRHCCLTCQQAPGARHDLDEEHRPLGTRFLERMGVW